MSLPSGKHLYFRWAQRTFETAPSKPKEVKKMEIEKKEYGYITPQTKALDKKYDPNKFRVPLNTYFLPDTLGHTEHEDVAGRLILKAQEEGQFVAVDYKTFATEIATEILNEKRAPEKQGLLKRLFGKKQPETKTPEKRMTVWTVELLNLPIEIMDMVDKNLLTLIEHEDKQILAPTDKLLSTIYEAQRA